MKAAIKSFFIILATALTFQRMCLCIHYAISILKLIFSKQSDQQILFYCVAVQLFSAEISGRKEEAVWILEDFLSEMMFDSANAQCWYPFIENLALND